MSRYQYQRPGNEDEFEEFCLRFYRAVLKRDSLDRYAKRGEEQYGIDLFDQLAIKPVACIQCKHREPHKTLTPAEIKAEVLKAENAPLRFEQYIIATSGRKSADAQNAVVELNERPDRKFEVLIHFWEYIESTLPGFGSVTAHYILTGERPEQPAYGGPVDTQRNEFRSPTEAAGNELYPEIAELFRQRKIEAAEHEIGKLPDPEKNTALPLFERYSILRWRTKLALERLNFEEACRLFLLAYDIQPHLEQAKFNRILAFEFSKNRATAFAEAKALVDAGNRSPTLLALLVRNVPSRSELNTYQSIIDEVSADNEEVCLAAANTLSTFGEWKESLRYAEQALLLEADSAHAHAAVAMASHQLGMEGDWRTRNQNIDRAITEYSSAIELAKNDKFLGLLPELLHNRGRLFGFLGKHADASRDFLEAVEVGDKPEMFVEEALSYFLSVGDYRAANELLPRRMKKLVRLDFYPS